MDLTTLLHTLSTRGAVLRVQGEALGVEPRGAVAGLEESIRSHKERVHPLVLEAGGLLALGGWPALLRATPSLVGGLEALRPPLLAVWVDGELALLRAWEGREALERHARFPGMPLHTPEGLLREALERLAQHYPHPGEVVLLAQWPGDPPRRERVARLHREEEA